MVQLNSNLATPLLQYMCLNTLVDKDVVWAAVLLYWHLLSIRLTCDDVYLPIMSCRDNNQEENKAAWSGVDKRMTRIFIYCPTSSPKRVAMSASSLCSSPFTRLLFLASYRNSSWKCLVFFYILDLPEVFFSFSLQLRWLSLSFMSQLFSGCTTYCHPRTVSECLEKFGSAEFSCMSSWEVGLVGTYASFCVLSQPLEEM